MRTKIASLPVTVTVFDFSCSVCTTNHCPILDKSIISQQFHQHSNSCNENSGRIHELVECLHTYICTRLELECMNWNYYSFDTIHAKLEKNVKNPSHYIDGLLKILILSNRTNKRKRTDGGNKKTTVCITLLKYIKDTQVKIHPTLRIRKTALLLINDIVITLLSRILLDKTPRQLSFTRIYHRMSKKFKQNAFSVVDVYLNKFFKKHTKDLMKSFSMNKEGHYLFKKLATFSRYNKLNLDDKSIICICIMIKHLIYLNCKFAGNIVKGTKRLTIDNKSIEDVQYKIYSDSSNTFEGEHGY